MGKVNSIIGVVIALLLLGLLLPIGLNDILGFTSTNTTVQTLVATVIPLMAIVGLIMAIIPGKKNGG